MIYDIVHRTTYEYDEPVTFSVGDAHLLTGELDGQRCLDAELRVSPEPEHYRERIDYFGNRAAHFSIREAHTVLEVTASATIDTSTRPDDLGPAGQSAWESVVIDASTPLEVLEYALDSTLVRRSAELEAYARPSFSPGRDLHSAATELCHRIHTDFAFDPKATDVDTPLEHVMENRRGVCQDFAHVMVGCLRSMGLAARYISGYLETTPPPGRPRLVGADRTHAWVGLHLGGGVWIGLDPTNDQVAGRHYLTTAHGRDYSDVPPLKGVIFTDAETSTLRVSVDVVAR